jgi:hypothetical protein
MFVRKQSCFVSFCGLVSPRWTLRSAKACLKYSATRSAATLILPVHHGRASHTSRASLSLHPSPRLGIPKLPDLMRHETSSGTVNSRFQANLYKRCSCPAKAERHSVHKHPSLIYFLLFPNFTLFLCRRATLQSFTLSILQINLLQTSTPSTCSSLPSSLLF